MNLRGRPWSQPLEKCHDLLPMNYMLVLIDTHSIDITRSNEHQTSDDVSPYQWSGVDRYLRTWWEYPVADDCCRDEGTRRWYCKHTGISKRCAVVRIYWDHGVDDFLLLFTLYDAHIFSAPPPPAHPAYGFQQWNKFGWVVQKYMYISRS